MTCPVCGTVAVPGARFCHNCGSALPAAATLPAAERRIVTVLFGDLSDFTAWAEDVDPERVGAVTDRVLAALAGAVKAVGGHVHPLARSGLGDEAPFVGREAELGRIAGRLAEVVDRGEPRILVMTGEAGLGKTRFAAEVERFAAGYPVGGFAPIAGARVLSVHCAAFG